MTAANRTLAGLFRLAAVTESLSWLLKPADQSTRGVLARHLARLHWSHWEGLSSIEKRYLDKSPQCADIWSQPEHSIHCLQHKRALDTCLYYPSSSQLSQEELGSHRSYAPVGSTQRSNETLLLDHTFLKLAYATLPSIHFFFTSSVVHSMEPSTLCFLHGSSRLYSTVHNQTCFNEHNLSVLKTRN